MTIEYNRCGDCYEVLALRYSKITLKRMGVDEYDADFIINNWIEVGYREAVRLSPRIPTGKYYYRCTKFDGSTHLCLVHSERPQVFRGFPWYDGKPNEANIKRFPRCSFWSDLKK